MSICIDESRTELEQIRRALREAPLVALRELLTDKAILDACRACSHEFRDWRYGPVVTVLHFVAQAVQREQSFAATWQESWTPLAASFPEVTADGFVPSALAHARARLPGEVMECLATFACSRTRGTEVELWHGLHLWALDCSTVSMPREAALFGHFGAHRARTTTVRYSAPCSCALGDFQKLLDKTL